MSGKNCVDGRFLLDFGDSGGQCYCAELLGMSNLEGYVRFWWLMCSK